MLVFIDDFDTPGTRSGNDNNNDDTSTADNQHHAEKLMFIFIFVSTRRSWCDNYRAFRMEQRWDADISLLVSNANKNYQLLNFLLRCGTFFNVMLETVES